MTKIFGYHIPLTAAEIPDATTGDSPELITDGIVGDGTSTIASASGSATEEDTTFIGRIKDQLTYIHRVAYNFFAKLIAAAFTHFKPLFEKSPVEQMRADLNDINEGKFSANLARQKLKKLDEDILQGIYHEVGAKQRDYVMTTLQSYNPFAADTVSLGCDAVTANDDIAIAAYKGYCEKSLAV